MLGRRIDRGVKMTNKELQDKLKEFPDDMKIELTRMYTCGAAFIGINESFYDDKVLEIVDFDGRYA
jgi:hypothetical protein